MELPRGRPTDGTCGQIEGEGDAVIRVGCRKIHLRGVMVTQAPSPPPPKRGSRG